MNIYALRDRLIDYYLTPFAAPNDKEVLASLANVINRPGATDGISQAPHHFELWQIGQVLEDGSIEPTKVLITDCSSLVRASIRKGRDGDSPTAEIATPTNYRPPGAAPGRTDA